MTYKPENFQKCKKEADAIISTMRKNVGQLFYGFGGQGEWEADVATRGFDQCLREQTPRIINRVKSCSIETSGLNVLGFLGIMQTPLLRENMNQCLNGQSPRIKDAFKR